MGESPLLRARCGVNQSLRNSMNTAPSRKVTG
jgi:hypothetical protein